ncbi:MAG: MFS transporter [Actinobacteria bacterium]|nr:MFS transporter [Actinomycetota bacterium]MBO0785535.1 MFS transporter [Actinomycetota bacterium]
MTTFQAAVPELESAGVVSAPPAPAAPDQVAGAPARLPGRPAWAERILLGAHRSAWRALAVRDFRYYFAGSLVSNVGTWFQNTAQVLLSYQLTHSVLAVGAVTGAQFSGSLLLGPRAAVIASRGDGRRLLAGTQLMSAALAGGMAVLEAAGMLSEQLLVVGALLLGLAFAFALPVQTALVPRLVPDTRAATEAGMTMNSVSYNAGRALAPALCVVLITTTGFAGAFALNAVSFLVFAVTLAVIRPRPMTRSKYPARARDGVTIALRQPRIGLLLLMVAAVTFADDPILILGPAVTRHLGAGSAWAGYFLSALGCGTIFGSLRPARRAGHQDGSEPSRLAAGWLVVLVGCVVFFAVSPWKWASLLAAFGAGAAALRTGAVTQTQLVRQPTAQAAASVMALWAIAWAGTKPLASLTDGWVASTHGMVWAVAAVAGPAAAIGILELALPQHRKDSLKAWARSAGTWINARLHPAG